MLGYRVVHAINRGYPLAVLGLYVVALLLALAMMFVHPFVTIFLFLAALAGLVLVVLMAWGLAGLEHSIARWVLARGSCPSCGGSMTDAGDATPAAGPERICPGCAASFTARGARSAGPEEPAAE
jgi:hypothetical protein